MLKLRNAQTFERYDYPGGYVREGPRNAVDPDADAGGGGRPPCGVGRQQLSLSRHGPARSSWPTIPGEKQSPAYVVRRVRHEATDTSYLTQVHAEPSHYDNSFEAIPYDVPFRPLRVTEKPVVHGPQTAIVVGPPGEKIHHRQARPRARAVPLGPLRQARRQELVLDPRVAVVGRRGWGGGEPCRMSDTR